MREREEDDGGGWKPSQSFQGRLVEPLPGTSVPTLSENFRFYTAIGVLFCQAPAVRKSD